MRIPQSAERLKEAPAQVLRAVLAREAPAQQALRAMLSKEAPAQALRAVVSGVGQVLLVTEKVRQRAMGNDRETAPAPPAAPVFVPAAPASPAPAAPAPATSAAPAAAAETVAAETAAPAKPAAAKTAPSKPRASKATAGTPPIPHYPELSVASLRARMRGLDAGQLSELLSYERAHENRDNVIAMFERRVAKLEQEGPATAG